MIGAHNTRLHSSVPQYILCLHDIYRDHRRNWADLKTLPKEERFENDAASFIVETAKPHLFESGYYFGLKNFSFDFSCEFSFFMTSHFRTL